MNLNQLLAIFSELGIKIWEEDGKLRLRAPKGALTPQLKTQLEVHKEKLLAYFKQAQSATTNRYYSIPLVKRDQPIPLSFAQEGLWFLERLEGKSSTYNISAARKIEGSFKLEVFKQSLAEIIRRHESLRTTFNEVNGEPRQVIHSHLPLPLTLVDLQSLDEKKQLWELQQLANEEAQQPFDLATLPLIRVKLFQLDSHSYVLLFTMHHIISDMWSMGIMVEELKTLYTAFTSAQLSPLAKLPLQYADYAHWQRKWLNEEVLERQSNYWAQQLAGIPPLLKLPTDRPRLPVQTLRGGSQFFKLDQTLTQQLKELSRTTKTTLYMTLLAAFMTLLSYYSGQKDIVVGSSIANRNQPGLKSLIGFFVNTLVMRGDLSANPTFRELLQRIRKVTLDAFAHQDFPFEKLVEKLHPERNLSYHPLFQVCFVLQTAPLGELDLPGVTLSSMDLQRESAMFDLMLSVEETTEGLQGFWEYNRDLFNGETIDRMIQRFNCLLENIVNNPDIPLEDIQIEPEITLPALVPTTTKFEEDIPLSYHQERLWFIDQFEMGNVYETSPIYHNVPLILSFDGSVNQKILEDSVNEVINRHKILKTKIVSENNQAFQILYPDECLKLKIENLTEDDEIISTTSLVEKALYEARKPFQLEKDLLIRGTLFTIGETKSLLVITIHHILVDRFSLDIIAKELTTIYHERMIGNPDKLASIQLQYTDYSQWQGNLPPNVLESLFLYWKQQLGTSISPLELPSNRPRPAIHTFTDARHTFVLDQHLTKELRSLSQQDNFDLFVVLLTAFKVLLHRYARQEEIIVGTSEPCRNSSEKENLVGPIANLLVLRSYLTANSTFREVSTQIDKIVKQARQHQEMPFERLVSQLNPEKDMSRTALFDVLFQFQDQQPLTVNLGTVEAQVIDTNIGYGKYDIHLFIQPIGDEFSGVVVYNLDLYDHFFIQQMMTHFQVILKAMIAGLETRINEVILLTPEEKQQQLFTWNTSDANYPQNKTVHQIFEEQVARTPDQIAVVCETETLTYQELNQQANQLAHYLIQKGVSPDTLVAVYLERSLDMIVSLIAIIKAGGAYLPIDPAYPEERVRFTLEDSQASLLVTQKTLVEQMYEEVPCVICLDQDWGDIASQANYNPITNTTPDNLIYCIYTSGSTGNPKGVLLEHRNVVRLMINDKHQFDFSEKDVWTMFHAYCFDFSVWEMYGALLYGGKLVVVQQSCTKEPSRFLDLLVEEKVSVLNQTPTFFASLSQEALKRSELPLPLRYVIFGGEALHPVQLKPWKDAYPHIRLINMYGITETTVHVTFKEITQQEIQDNISNVGRPIPTMTTYIMDDKQQLLPVGVVGEICVGGDGVSRGYLNREELTAQRFISNPYQPQERLYRSGDLGKFLPNGEIVHLGRIDHQVKIRGFRVELDEIQSQLLEHPAVKEAVVITHKFREQDLNLVAYVVLNAEVSISELRDDLAQKLPHFMIPAMFIKLDFMPITSNGKLNRRALPTPESMSRSQEEEYVPPRDALEMELVKIWENLLQAHPIGIQEDFFEIGGHSLLAVRLMAKIEEQLGQNLPLSTLFQGATVEKLATILRQQVDRPSPPLIVGIQTQGTKPPFFCVHPVGGNILCYSALANRLGNDHPFYGLQARGISGQEQPHTQVEDMATDYIEAIKTIQSQGPYYIGGWSFGGLVAFEMAQQLHRQGEQVGLLGLIDTRAPIPELSAMDIDETAITLLLTQDISAIVGSPLDISSEILSQLNQEEQLNYILTAVKQAQILPPDTELKQMKQILKVYQANIQATLDYQASIYPNSVTLLRAENSSSLFSEWISDKLPDWINNQTYGWERFSTQPIVCQTIAGDHYSILTEPNVKNLATQFNHYLD